MRSLRRSVRRITWENEGEKPGCKYIRKHHGYRVVCERCGFSMEQDSFRYDSEDIARNHVCSGVKVVRGENLDEVKDEVSAYTKVGWEVVLEHEWEKDGETWHDVTLEKMGEEA